MPIGEIGYVISYWLVFIALAISSVYGLFAVYYAYIKTKDERQKYIVLRSTAHAFTVLLCYYIIQMIVVFADVAELTWLWELLHFNINAVPAVTIMSVLGVCLFINKRKAGGA